MATVAKKMSGRMVQLGQILDSHEILDSSDLKKKINLTVTGNPRKSFDYKHKNKNLADPQKNPNASTYDFSWLINFKAIDVRKMELLYTRFYETNGKQAGDLTQEQERELKMPIEKFNGIPLVKEMIVHIGDGERAKHEAQIPVPNTEIEVVLGHSLSRTTADGLAIDEKGNNIIKVVDVKIPPVTEVTKKDKNSFSFAKQTFVAHKEESNKAESIVSEETVETFE